VALQILSTTTAARATSPGRCIWKGQASADSRPNVLLFLAVLSVLFQFLANQREILETGFEDAAALGSALSHVFPYAAALIVFVLAYRHTKGD
jgi:ABC-type uncharacterized transport system permease subunit